MKKGLIFLVLQFVYINTFFAQNVPPIFDVDLNDAEPPAIIDRFIVVGLLVAVVLIIMKFRQKNPKY